MLLLIACPWLSLQIQDIVRSRQLLTIFREGKYGQQDVDVAILQALFKGEGWGPPWEKGRGHQDRAQATSYHCLT